MRNNCLVIFFVVLLLSACSPAHTGLPFAQVAGPQGWFDAPLPGTVVRPPNPCQIVAHGASPNGIALFELSVNGVVVASIPSPDTKASLVTLTRDCGLSQPGEYLLRLRVQDNAGGWSGFAETHLIIPGGETPTLPSTSRPTLTPTTVPAGDVSIQQISTTMVYLGQASCGPLDVSITAHATAPKGITVVVLFYRFSAGNSSSGFQNVAMDPIGGDLYQRSLNPTSLLGGSISFDQATLQYQVVVQQKDGDTSIRTPILTDIAVQACGSAAPALVCSSYTDKRSCVAHGCNWVSKPSVVSTYVCQNP